MLQRASSRTPRLFWEIPPPPQRNKARPLPLQVHPEGDILSVRPQPTKGLEEEMLATEPGLRDYV